MPDHYRDDIASIKPENPLPPDMGEENNARLLAFFGILVAVALIVLVLAEASHHKTGLMAENFGTDGKVAAATGVPPATQTGITGTPVVPAAQVPPEASPARVSAGAASSAEISSPAGATGNAP